MMGGLSRVVFAAGAVLALSGPGRAQANQAPPNDEVLVAAQHYRTAEKRSFLMEATCQGRPIRATLSYQDRDGQGVGTAELVVGGAPVPKDAVKQVLALAGDVVAIKGLDVACGGEETVVEFLHSAMGDPDRGERLAYRVVSLRLRGSDVLGIQRGSLR